MVTERADPEGTVDVHVTRYLIAGAKVRGRRALDAACGVGYGSALLSQGARRVVGVDTSAEAIAGAAARFARENLRFAVADAAALPFRDGSFDFAASFETIEHVLDPERTLAEIARVLEPGAPFFASVPNGDLDRPKKNPYHRHFFTLEQFRLLLSGRFDVVLTRGLAPDFSRPGLAAVEVPRALKRLVPRALRDVLNRFRFAQGRVTAPGETASAPSFFAECVRR